MMEFKIEKKSFTNSLGWAQSVVEKKTTMPILTHVLLETKGPSLSLTATDLEVTARDSVRAEVSSPGKASVPARQLYDIVKELPEALVEVKSLENHWIQIQCAKSNYKLVGLDGNEFPKFLVATEGKELQLEAKTILEMLDKTAFAVSMDESRYNLNGVLLEVVPTAREEEENKNTVRMVATDGHRLSLVDRPLPKKVSLSGGVIVPRKGIGEIRRLLADGAETKENFSCFLDEKHIRIDYGNKSLVMRLIDGQFPQYSTVIPKKLSKVLSVEKNTFLQALRRVSVVTNNRSRGIKFSISPGNLEMSTTNTDVGEAKEELTVQYKGPAFEIGFNAFYFMDCLGVMEDETVVLQLGDEVSPCLIQSEKDRGFSHVIMPMRL